MAKIKIGDKVRFDPCAEVWIPGYEEKREKVTGTVIEINKDRHWFAVEYKLGDKTLRTAFHFVDLEEGYYARRAEIIRE